MEAANDNSSALFRSCRGDLNNHSEHATKLFGALVRQLCLLAGCRGWVDERFLEFVASDRKWPRLLRPVLFGYVLPSKRTVNDFFASSTVYVPSYRCPPCTAALFSSAVPCTRFFDANFGTSDRTMMDE